MSGHGRREFEGRGDRMSSAAIGQEAAGAGGSLETGVGRKKRTARPKKASSDVRSQGRRSRKRPQRRRAAKGRRTSGVRKRKVAQRMRLGAGRDTDLR